MRATALHCSERQASLRTRLRRASLVLVEVEVDDVAHLLAAPVHKPVVAVKRQLAACPAVQARQRTARRGARSAPEAARLLIQLAQNGMASEVREWLLLSAAPAVPWQCTLADHTSCTGIQKLLESSSDPLPSQAVSMLCRALELQVSSLARY